MFKTIFLCFLGAIVILGGLGLIVLSVFAAGMADRQATWGDIAPGVLGGAFVALLGVGIIVAAF